MAKTQYEIEIVSTAPSVIMIGSLMLVPLRATKLSAALAEQYKDHPLINGLIADTKVMLASGPRAGIKTVEQLFEAGINEIATAHADAEALMLEQMAAEEAAALLAKAVAEKPEV